MTNPATMPELLPCPFCGGRAVAYKQRNVFEDCEIECSECCVNGGNFDNHGSERGAYELNLFEATAAWNTRAPSPLTDERREAALVHIDWYAEHAISASRYIQDKNANADALMSLLTTLALDAGRRAEAIRAALTGKMGE